MRIGDLLFGCGVGLAVAILYWISPEAGRTFTLVSSVVFLVAMVVVFLRRLKQPP